MLHQLYWAECKWPFWVQNSPVRTISIPSPQQDMETGSFLPLKSRREGEGKNLKTEVCILIFALPASTTPPPPILPCFVIWRCASLLLSVQARVGLLSHSSWEGEQVAQSWANQCVALPGPQWLVQGGTLVTQSDSLRLETSAGNLWKALLLLFPEDVK